MSVARIATVANTRRHRVVWDRVPELPTVQAAWWGSREQALFVSFFRDPLEYMDNELFANPSAEETIFGRPVQLIPDAARFVDIGGDFTCGRDPAEPDEESNILTTSQEIALFQRFNYARKRLAQQCCEYVNGQLNEEGLRELLAWGDCVNATCNFLAASTMPIARVMARQPRFTNLDFVELLSEGNSALFRAIMTFDCARGYRFSTYACRVILKSFSHVVRRHIRQRGLFTRDLESSSYEQKLHVVAIKRHEDYWASVRELCRSLEDNRACLTDIELRVLRERFALGADPDTATPKSLDEVSEIVGLTSEGVRRAQKRALAKLRASMEMNHLVA